MKVCDYCGKKSKWHQAFGFKLDLCHEHALVELKRAMDREEAIA